MFATSDPGPESEKDIIRRVDLTVSGDMENIRPNQHLTGDVLVTVALPIDSCISQEYRKNTFFKLL